MIRPLFLFVILTCPAFLQGQQILNDVPVTKEDTVKIRDITGRDELQGHVNECQHDILLLKLGYTSNIYSGIEIGFLLNKRPREKGSAMILSKRGPAAGAEFIFKNQDLIIAPKLCYDIYFWALFALRQNLIYYNDLKGNDAFRYRVDLGLSLVGYFNLLYGFNINITERQLVAHPNSFTMSVALSLFSRRMKTYKDFGDMPTYILEYPYIGPKKMKHRLINLG